ncbi:hypothetical protein K501DRAFT_241006 [Backusella circina FSU 941]|nr:hypothetical protein K501DRAFT_241006 [Backusella circina FSU 941]
MKAIGHCEKLKTLTIQECFVDPDIGFGIDDILSNCKGLKTLYIKDTHIFKIGSGSCLNNHPLKKLIFKRSSFTNHVFPYLSSTCPQLEHVNLLGCFQTDRRDQLFIYLPYQNLKSLQIQGLRTRNYYTGCRIRFFAITEFSGQHIPEAHSNEICFDPSFNSSWYYMSQYDVRYHPVGRKLSFQKFRNMEYASAFNRLDSWDIKDLQALVTNKTLKAWDIEAAKRNLNTPRTISLISNESWVPENIYYSGFVNIVVNSVEALSINKKTI